MEIICVTSKCDFHTVVLYLVIIVSRYNTRCFQTFTYEEVTKCKECNFFFEWSTDLYLLGTSLKMASLRLLSKVTQILALIEQLVHTRRRKRHNGTLSYLFCWVLLMCTFFVKNRKKNHCTYSRLGKIKVRHCCPDLKKSVDWLSSPKHGKTIMNRLPCMSSIHSANSLVQSVEEHDTVVESVGVGGSVTVCLSPCTM